MFLNISINIKINHFVITLIAILDMSRIEELILEQSKQFDEIIIRKGVNY